MIIRTAFDVVYNLANWQSTGRSLIQGDDIDNIREFEDLLIESYCYPRGSSCCGVRTGPTHQ